MGAAVDEHGRANLLMECFECSYYISSPNEYLVITGAGIADLRIAKKALVMPWQRVR